MLNKLPIGQTAEYTDVGANGTGNDQQNRNDIDRSQSASGGGITLERKRPRYSIIAMAINGPNNNEVGTAYDVIGPEVQGGFFDVDAAEFRPSTCQNIEFSYKMREPTVFLGGNLFIGDDTSDIPSETSIVIYKNNVKVEERKFANGPSVTGPVSAFASVVSGDMLVDLPGARSFFATDEVFKLTVTPDSDTGDAATDGLIGVSALLWFKALHV